MTVNTCEKIFPWSKTPLIVGAPMRMISLAPLAVAISRAGGLGFIGAGTDLSTLSKHLADARHLLNIEPIARCNTRVLPVGIGIICHSACLSTFRSALADPATSTRPPAAIWLFAPREPTDLKAWVDVVRTTFPQTTPQIWVQAGSVVEAISSCIATDADVLVVQGIDAGGHGLAQGAGLVSLLPEVSDALQKAKANGEIIRVPSLVAAGGIVDGRSAAASIILGANAICMGTIYLTSHEAEIAIGYKREVIRASDGGQSTVRTRLYDSLRGTYGWPVRFNGRGVINRSYEDSLAGLAEAENKSLYEKAPNQTQGFGPEGRLTTYAGTAVGLVQDIRGAADITEHVRTECCKRLNSVKARI